MAMKINKHIVIVRSSVGRLTSMGTRSSNAIYAVLAKHFSRVGVTTVDSYADLESLTALQPDLVFLGMKFVPAEAGTGKVWLSEYLDEQGIVYTGSARTAIELEFSKPKAKQHILDAGLETSPFLVVEQGNLLGDSSNMEFPLFIKPTDRGGGTGIDKHSVANNFLELTAKIAMISNNLKSDSLVEEYLPGREFSVSILKDELSDKLIIMPLELIAPADASGARFLSQEVKSSDTEQAVEIFDPVLKHRVSLLAQKVFNSLGARDYGRIDIRLDKKGTPHFLEANLLPSLTSGYGNFPKSCALMLKLNHESMILHIDRKRVE